MSRTAAAPAPALVRAAGLTRRFGDRLAVDRLALEVGAGEVLALLGPNGAGKTTTLRMIAGLIAPSAGDVRTGGAVGLLTESPGLWERLPVRQNVLTHARLHGLTDPGGATDRALAAVGLADRARDAAGQLSKGLRQRVAIARALVHDPLVVLLDEPTSGLDPASARQVRELILGLRADGRAVIVSTHNLAEAEALADRIAILKTRLLALDTPDALRHRLRGVRVEIEIDGEAAPWQAALAELGGRDVTARGARAGFVVEAIPDIPAIVSGLAARGARLVRVSPEQRTLEEVYLSLVGAAAEDA
ncbi:MAG: ABC transporter ATP-binding protein [Vicinamibacterales bacterium]